MNELPIEGYGSGSDNSTKKHTIMAKLLKILIMKIYNEDKKEEKHVFNTMISITNIVRK